MIDINNIKGLQELFKEKLFEVASIDKIIEDIYPIVRLANYDIEYDNIIWDICADIVTTVNDFQLYKLYEDSFEEITDYWELGFSALAYVKIIDADKFVKELAKIEDNVDDIGLYLDDLFNLAEYDLVDGHIYSQNYNGDWFDISLAEEIINKRKDK